MFIMTVSDFTIQSVLAARERGARAQCSGFDLLFLSAVRQPSISIIEPVTIQANRTPTHEKYK
jgi:hypothetical protein